MQLDQQLGGRAIGEMAARARDPALHRRRVAAGPERDLVVVRLQDHGAEVRAGDSARPPSAGRGRTPRRRWCHRARAARPRSGSAASWLVGQAWIRRTGRPRPERRARAAGARRGPCRRPARSRCPDAVSTGTPRRRASRERAAGVVAMLVRQRDRRRPVERRARQSPRAARSSRALNPASTRSAAPSDSTAKQLPRDPSPARKASSSARYPARRCGERLLALRSELDVPPRHHPLGDAEEAVLGQPLLSRAPPGEWRHDTWAASACRTRWHRPRRRCRSPAWFRSPSWRGRRTASPGCAGRFRSAGRAPPAAPGRRCSSGSRSSCPRRG